MRRVAGVVASLFVGVGLAVGQAKPAAAFEVASVRLSDPKGDGVTSFDWAGTNRFTTKNASLMLLLEIAYRVDDYQVKGLPGWADSTTYDITAKVEGDTKLKEEEIMPLLQRLLAERLHMVAHRETKMMKGYALVVAKGGPKLKADSEPGGQINIFSNGIQGRSVEISTLSHILTRPLGQPVVDKTGVEGTYDVDLKFAPMSAPVDAPESSLPSIFTAMVEQMGLKLEAQMVPVEVLVVDAVEKMPTEN